MKKLVNVVLPTVPVYLDFSAGLNWMLVLMSVIARFQMEPFRANLVVFVVNNSV